MGVISFKQWENLFVAEWRRSVKLMRSYPLDTINSIITFIIMSTVFMIGIDAVGDSSQVFGVIFFPVMLNLISGPSASIRGDIELGVFEQVYTSRYSLIKTAIIRTLISGLTSLIGSLLIALIMHFFFLKIKIGIVYIIVLFILFCTESIAVGVIMAAVTLRFRKVETLLNFINILIMIELVLPLNSATAILNFLPMAITPFYGVVVLYQQVLANYTIGMLLPTLVCTIINMFLLTAVARFTYRKSLISAQKNGTLGQY